VDDLSFLERWRAPILCLLATLAVGSAEFLRLAKGWPVNRDWYPEVVGPGDAATFHLDRKVSGTLNGLWAGTATAKVTNAAEVGLANPNLTAFSRSREWHNMIHTHPSARGIEAQPWIRIYIPNEPQLAHQVVSIEAEVNATYPSLTAMRYYEEHEQSVSQSVRLWLAAPGAGQLYNLLWWFGVMGGCGALIVICVGHMALANQLKRTALPARAIEASAIKPSRKGE
jgi:hypothetical protein